MVRNIFNDLCFLFLLLSCIMSHISIIIANAQNLMIYGSKLIANSGINPSRKKYKYVIANIDVRSMTNI